MRFFEAPDGQGDTAIWLDTQGVHEPIVCRADLREFASAHWPHIVRALTAGPTMESARVVVDVLREEIAALTAANRDLNDELTSLRRELGR